MPKRNLLNDPAIWGAIIAAKFVREIGLPPGNYWEPAIARTLAKAVTEGHKTRDQIELLMALQLGIAKSRNSQVEYQGEVYEVEVTPCPIN